VKTEAEWLEALRGRLEKRVERVTETGCWLWNGRLDRKGYARLSLWRRDKRHYVLTLAHRLAFKAFVRDFPTTSVIMHRCDTPCCINPSHLVEGTQAQNIHDMLEKKRERGVGFNNRNKTHCNAGHPLSGENLRIEGKRKARRCKACENIKKGRNK
jgi:hypothetical protein